MSFLKKVGAVLGALAVTGALLAGVPARAAGKEVTISHYFTGDLGHDAITKIFADFEKKTGIHVTDSPTGHEDFKTAILVMAAGRNLPDVFSYWAGARTQFVVDSGALRPIDDMWKSSGLDAIVPPAVAKGATLYNGKRYLVPFGYHYAGLFYNKKVLAKAGIIAAPGTWPEFLAACKTLKAAGVTPIALGSKNRWPGQFWFDYLILRTAGPEYRARLMAGQASYTDPEVKGAMKLWKDLVDAGYFAKNANADDWTDAADKVSRGDAGMTLMGTWITGYWDNLKPKAFEDYDFYEFPVIDSKVAKAAVGPVDGLVISANAKNPEGAKELLGYLIKDTQAQAAWAKAQGALSPNVKVDPASYSPVMRRALDVVADAKAFAFNYDLATTPPAAEVGLSMFAEFMNNPADYPQQLARAQTQVSEVFKKK
jgi:multiple sugar transport system substrate-binding protein/raffinose/stachyose/melibiose transport system substrate-binding protein